MTAASARTSASLTGGSIPTGGRAGTASGRRDEQRSSVVEYSAVGKSVQIMASTRTFQVRVG